MRTNSEPRRDADTYLAPGGEQEELIAQFSALVKGISNRAVLRGQDGTEVHVPEEIFKILVRVADEMQRGRAVTVIPRDHLLTTQEGADLLGVSRPTFVKMLETGRIPFRKVGRHRRVKLEDLKNYTKNEREERSKLLKQVAATTQDTETFYPAAGL